jgi:hypothetical protein
VVARLEQVGAIIGGTFMTWANERIAVQASGGVSGGTNLQPPDNMAGGDVDLWSRGQIAGSNPQPIEGGPGSLLSPDAAEGDTWDAFGADIVRRHQRAFPLRQYLIVNKRNPDDDDPNPVTGWMGQYLFRGVGR